MKIIFIDDEIASLHTFIFNIVDNADIECQMFVKDYELAKEYVKNNEVDAAFIDVKLPKISGIELAKELLEIKPKLKIAFITGFIQKEEEILSIIPKDNLLGILYKPYNKELLEEYFNKIRKLINKENKVFLHTFGSFDLFINEKAVYFSSSKAKELLALLVDANGSYVYMDRSIEYLWGEKDINLGKRLYRDAVFRLRQTLKNNGVESLVRFERGCAVINKNNVSCDLWEFLEGKREYNGSYLDQYGWSIITELRLEEKSKI